MNLDLDLEKLLYIASIWAIPVLLGVTLHEAAHGWTAKRLGDDTAERLGRVSFNPFRHIDPFGTVLLPALLLFASGGRTMFGFAKPVPVNFLRLRNPRSGMILVALAGPLSNVVLALLSMLAFNLVQWLPVDYRGWVVENLVNSVHINVLLAVFNMLPLLPLDGGRVVAGLLPTVLAQQWARLERFGMLVILGALLVLPWLGAKLGLQLDVFRYLVGIPATWLADFLVVLTGLGGSGG